MSTRAILGNSCTVRVPDRTRREILREHEQLKKRIQDETGCDAFDAHLRAWTHLFEIECSGDAAVS
jgi:hypothetical protein